MGNIVKLGCLNVKFTLWLKYKSIRDTTLHLWCSKLMHNLDANLFSACIWEPFNTNRFITILKYAFADMLITYAGSQTAAVSSATGLKEDTQKCLSGKGKIAPFTLALLEFYWSLKLSYKWSILCRFNLVVGGLFPYFHFSLRKHLMSF